MLRSAGAAPRPASMPYRVSQLLLALLLYGFSIAMLVRSDLGLLPWGVLDQGLSRQLGWSLGTCSVVSSMFVLLLWFPLRQRPGWGTLTNVIVIGPAIDLSLWVLPVVGDLLPQVVLAVGGIVGNAVATAFYIGASFGPGPRDGLMTGLTARTGWSLRVVRTGIEVAVVAVGWSLGGTVGVATLGYALAVGPLVHLLLPRVTRRRPPPDDPSLGRAEVAPA